MLTFIIPIIFHKYLFLLEDKIFNVIDFLFYIY